MSDWPVTIEIPVLWGDMDALGHVNNIRYFRWFESARIALFQAVGIDASVLNEAGPILATTTCDFLRPVTWPATVVIGSRVPKIGNTSFVSEYAAWLVDDPGTLVARGSGVIVLVNYQTGAKVPISDEIRAALQTLA